MLKHIRSLAARLFWLDTRSSESSEIGQALYGDELDCARAILATDTVQDVYKRIDAAPEDIQARLHTLQRLRPAGEVWQVLGPGSLWHRHMVSLKESVPLEVCRLIGLFVHGSETVKQALTPVGRQPGDIPFLVAHKQPEWELRSLWPSPSEQTGHGLLLNDSFTPMELVVSALEGLFGMTRESAIKRMLEVHHAGRFVIEMKPGSDVADACARFNAAWRSQGLPLYCLPERSTGTSRVPADS